MLEPESRLLLSDALRPPDGAKLDLAVATTYSLDLAAMLLAPLFFTGFDTAESDPALQDPIRLLEAVRRYGERTTIFCQAGAITVPASGFVPALAFLEDSVVEVNPPQGVFHPKVWALRFVNSVGVAAHRLLVLSRNLTWDRSWDTIVRCDEEPDLVDPTPTGPLIEFLRSLGTGSRAEQVEDLCSTLAQARFKPPEPFTSLEFLPSGVGRFGYAFPEAADRVLAISPFLSKPALAALAQVTKERVLVSRPESFDHLGVGPLLGWDTRTLQAVTEVMVPEEEPDGALGEGLAPSGSPPLSGLHAKTFVFDCGPNAEVITGSANLTQSGWMRNVEFGIRLRGPKKHCGVAAALGDGGDTPGLEALLTPYRPEHVGGADDPAEKLRLAIERAHAALVAAHPVIDVSALASERVNLRLSTQSAWVNPGKTWVALLTERAGQRTWMGGGMAAQWLSLARASLTPYLIVSTTVSAGQFPLTRQCVIKAELRGDVGDRASEVLAQVLRSQEDVQRYLLFLLGDGPAEPAATEVVEPVERAIWAGVDGASYFRDHALFEPLIRAVGRNEMALLAVDSLVKDLRQIEGGQGLIPDGFDDLWAVVWEVHQETRS